MTTENHERDMLEDRYIRDFARSTAVRRRRNRLLAEWLAAQALRNDTAAYVESILHIGESEPADAQYCRRIIADVGLPCRLNEQDLLAQMHALVMVAAKHLAQEHGGSDCVD